MKGLHKRTRAHAARPPQQGIVRRVALGKQAGIGEQDIAHAIDPAEEIKIDPCHRCHGDQAVAVLLPDIGRR